MLILARKTNESIIIGETIVVSVVEIKGEHVKLGITAPPDVKVYRQEVFEAIQAENQAAARGSAELPSLEELAPGSHGKRSPGGGGAGGTRASEAARPKAGGDRPRESPGAGEVRR